MRGRLRTQVADAFAIHSRATFSLVNPFIRRTLLCSHVATTDHWRGRLAGDGTTLNDGAVMVRKGRKDMDSVRESGVSHRSESRCWLTKVLAVRPLYCPALHYPSFGGRSNCRRGL